MRIELSRRGTGLVVAVLALVSAASGHATEPADLPVSADAEAAHQVEADPEHQDWRLDPAIFTEISLVNAPDVAIKLPEDQRDEH